MTQRDVWAKRPVVLRYRAFCDELRRHVGDVPEKVCAVAITAKLPMPDSWSAKKQAAYDGTLMQQKPDCDNIAKAILDALFENDAVIGQLSITKIWCKSGQTGIDIELFAAE